jgi:hypothetical protein
MGGAGVPTTGVETRFAWLMTPKSNVGHLLTNAHIGQTPSTECHIYVPTYNLIISATGFLYCLKNRKLLNYKHFLVFFILLSLEIMFLLIYIPKLALPQMEKIHHFTIEFAPWEIIVRVG